MKKSTCVRCRRHYWAQTTPAQGSNMFAAELASRFVSRESQPKTKICKPCNHSAALVK